MLAGGLQHLEHARKAGRYDTGLARPEFAGGTVIRRDADTAGEHVKIFMPTGMKRNAPGARLAGPDTAIQAGILRDMLGPGRHFFSPREYELKIVPDIEIAPGKLGVVGSENGTPLPAGAYVSDQDGHLALYE